MESLEWIPNCQFTEKYKSLKLDSFGVTAVDVTFVGLSNVISKITIGLDLRVDEQFSSLVILSLSFIEF